MPLKTFTLFFIFLFQLIFLSSCVIGFTNAQHQVPVKYSKIYVPSANDSSIYAGNSSRLSNAVRASLANHTDVEITDIQNARVALQIKILDRKQIILAVDSCNNAGTPTVGSGAYRCDAIHPEMLGNPNAITSFNQPSASPSSESVTLIVIAKAIDLNSGKLLWSKPYTGINASFNEIGDQDNTTITNMANKPALHGLRYQEAIDNAVQIIANTIASDLQASLLSSFPTD